ncbi:galectin-3-like isoform X2 [Syngnathoides biaculeatus]|uniref:galectin-3-like isoform X2 n=1 Tax=Syngnathoides biaculeatus TaxID=300417 RepID=UPI002ADE1443|nr:galectin-3-like isoform X2 [Syngnathoides biaculeatus]
MDVSSPPNYQLQAQHADLLCGSCPPGSAPQPGAVWPGQTPGGAFPVWPAQPTQQVPQVPPAQQAPQAAPCWTGQPNTPCWLGTQPLPVSGPTPLPVPAQILTPSPAPAAAPAQAVAPVQSQICQPCWPGQYQPAQPVQAPQPPVQAQIPFQVPAVNPVAPPAPAPVSAPAHAPAPSLHPSVPSWGAHPGWPYNPGQPGWPGQTPALVPQHWLPPTSGPLSVPYNLNLARGVYDKMMMTILGQIKPNAKMFTINFLRGNDIAFHINPRFTEGGKQVLVRNHKLGERWGPEERDLKGPFPFALGSPFEVTSPRVECQANVWLKRWKGLERRLGKLVLNQRSAAPQGDSWR